MSNQVALQAKTHKFLSDKYKGNTSETFASLINSSLSQSGIQLDFNDNKQRRDAFKAYAELVDFKTMFVDTLNNILIDKWSATSESWRIWINNYELTDFRRATITATAYVPQPKKIAPGGEYGITDLYGEQSNAKLDTYGAMINIERQTIFDDDISAINSFLSGIANAYDRQIGDKVYSLLKDNPVTFDGRELFHADHNNVLVTSSFDNDLLRAIILMGSQKTHLNDTSAETVKIQPKYVIVSPDLILSATDVIGKYNQGAALEQQLTVISEARLIGFSGWFLACDNPSANLALFTLRNKANPEIFTSTTFNHDGLMVKHRMDYDVKPTDYRGLVRVLSA